MELAPAPSSVMAAGAVKLVSRMSPGLAFEDEADAWAGRGARQARCDQDSGEREHGGCEETSFHWVSPQESSDSDPDYWSLILHDH